MVESKQAPPGGVSLFPALRRLGSNITARAPEEWGVRPVPAERKSLRPFDLAVLWGDLAVSLLVMVAGSLLVPGLSTREAMAAILLGTALGTVLLALAGVAGSEMGVPTMVGLRASFGVRGSYLASGFNIVQLVGWAALEIIIMSQAARALSKEYLGFSGYYFWLVVFGVLATLMAVGGPVVVVRQWMQKFGIWVVVGASLWLTYHLFDAYDVGAIWDRSGEGGFPNFFQGVDLVVALPISWLPLVCDYNRFARRGSAGAVATYVGYSVANAWFFALSVFYVQALQTDPGGFIDSLVTMLLPLSAGWLALIVLLAGETDEGFANVYSTAVSIQNLAPKLRHALIAVAVGVIAVIIAISIDLVQYENFLLLIGGVFVPVFGIFIADYFIVRRRSYEMEELYRGPGAYWYTKGVSLLAVTVWVTGFLLYSLAAQPPWLLENADFISWAPTWATHIGGTMPALVFSFVAYWAGAQWLLRPRRAEASAIPASAEGS